MFNPFSRFLILDMLNSSRQLLSKIFDSCHGRRLFERLKPKELAIWSVHRDLKAGREWCQARTAVTLSHTVFGDPPSATSNPSPVIILHGIFGSKQNWTSIAKSLSQRLNRTMITLDARNHGDSPHSPVMTYPEMAEDVSAYMEGVGLKKAIMLGHSMGGKIMMTLALTRPELVEALIVGDISPRISSSIGIIPNYIEAMKKIKLSSSSLTMSQARKEADEQLTWTAPEAGIRAFLLTNLSAKDSSVTCGWPVPAADGDSPFCFRVNLTAFANEFMNIMLFPESLPHKNYKDATLFLCGADSSYVTDEDLPDIRRFFPKAVVKHLQGAGHWVHSQKPAEFMDEVVAFVRKV